jgi:hypothetical protein
MQTSYTQTAEDRQEEEGNTDTSKEQPESQKSGIEPTDVKDEGTSKEE